MAYTRLRWRFTVSSSHMLEVGLVCCTVFEPEIRLLASTAPNVRSMKFIDQSYHDRPNVLREHIRTAIAELETDPLVEVVVFGFGLCSRTIEQLTTTRCPLVIPRAHDCISLLLGSAERYASCMKECPGTYWYSRGWLAGGRVLTPEKLEQQHAEIAAKYDVELADEMLESERQVLRTYQRACYVDLGLFESHADFERTKQIAAAFSWEPRLEHGDPGWLTRMLTGPWDEREFLVLQPGEMAECSGDEHILRKVAPRPVPVKP